MHIIEVDDFNVEELEPYTCTAEVQLLRRYEPEPGIFVAETPKVILRALDAGYRPLSLLVDRKLIGGRAKEVIARCGDVPVYAAEEKLLAHIVGYKMIQGVLCVMRRRRLPSPAEVCAGAERIAVLEGIVNPANIGAIFRSAAALDFDAVLLTDACSDPFYRRAARVSMGTVFQIPWTYLGDRGRGYVSVLREMGFATAAMALRDDTVGIDDPALAHEEKLAVILGTEGEGLREDTIRECGYTVKIPMAHGVDSLNVAAASAVAFWQLGKGRRAAAPGK